MAITDDIIFLGASGRIGEFVIKTYRDKTVIAKRPDMRNRVLSEKQRQANKRMVEANRYAKSLYGSEEQRLTERIRLKLPQHKSLYHALIKEYLDKNKPE